MTWLGWECDEVKGGISCRLDLGVDGLISTGKVVVRFV